MPYVAPASAMAGIPQGDAWVGTKVEKLFCTSKEKLAMYPGSVTEVTITGLGMGRLRIVYDDGDCEVVDIPNAIPWILLSPDNTWLETHGLVDRGDLPREAHVYLCMLESTGRLREEAKEIQKKAPRFVAKEASSFQYKTVSPGGLPAPMVDSGPMSTQEGYGATLQEEKLRMDKTSDLAHLKIQRAQAVQAKAYSTRKRPRNKRVEALEVGAHCRISPTVPPGSRGKTRLKWSDQVYRITSHGRGRVQVAALDDPADTHDKLAQNVLPIATPISSGSDSN
ncbi:hypothetical protein WJX74_007288 [Apatococcus lobatus]|uniref:Uncharacterized protein n=2 Tax=Apatococcus TaxID=904362 RepID=A0AAW1REF3_9CHLO